MSVIIEEMEGTIEPEAAPPPGPQESGGFAAPKELSLDKLRSELARLAQRERRLRAD